MGFKRRVLLPFLVLLVYTDTALAQPPMVFPKDGSLSTKDIKAVVRRNLKGVKYCYEKALKNSPKLAGKIVLNIDIVHGSVGRASFEYTEVKDAEFEGCFLRQVARWKFPDNGDAVTNVAYPFIFAPDTDSTKPPLLRPPKDEELVLPLEMVGPF